MKRFLIIALILASSFSYSQVETPYGSSQNDPEWVQYMYSENPNIYTLRELHDSYYDKNEFTKNNHTQYYKRFLKTYWLTQDENGTLNTERKSYNSIKSPTSPWEEMGPWDYDHEQSMEFEIQSPGAAHVYTVEQSPIDPDVVYAGTATAGLWKSIDKGMNWELKTRDMDINGVYSIALDSFDVNIVYMGERNGQVWKSIDGGDSWNLTGDASFQSGSHFVRDLKFIGTDILLVATEDGLFRSPDAGANWNLVHPGEHMEIELKPDNSNIIYSVKLTSTRTEFYKSIDNGLTWVQKPTGWPLPSAGDEQKRTEIATSIADPNVIYALAAGEVGPDEGLYGIYKSTDAGESFNFVCCGGFEGGTASPGNPNILGYAELGDENGGQYYYDLSIDISPNDIDRAFSTGVNVWRTVNGGVDWEINGHWVTWVGDYKHRYSHADVHDVKFFKHAGGTDMWVASDGGLYYSSTEGDTLEPRMHGIHGTDFWGFGTGFKNGDVMIGGTYHNGTVIKYNDIYKGGLANPEEGGWLAELGGDNYRGFVNYGDTMIGYSDQGAFKYSDVREIRKTTSAFDNSKVCNTSYVTGEYGTYGFSPICYKEIYSPVGTELYKSTTGGTSFELLHDFGGSKVIQVKVSWADPKVIYVTQKFNSTVFKIWKATDGGINWTDVTGNLTSETASGNKVKYIELDEEDPNKLWVILMGYQVNDKVYESIDGGNSWQNITSPSINGESIISISHQFGTDDALYIGTRKTVYYKDGTMTDWVPFNAELPASTAVSFLEPFYSERKLRAATQRGVYQVDFYGDSEPVAMPSADKLNINLSASCDIDSVQFMDHSTVNRSSATWSWTFEGGFPSSSNEENPIVYYDTEGSFDVTLVITDAFGTDSITIEDFIVITNSIGSSPNISEDFNGPLFPPAGWKLYDSEGSSWEHDWPEGDDSDKVASFPNYWVDAFEQTHLLIMPSVDLINSNWTELSFDYSYHDNNGYEDTLAVVYRTASNTEWTTIWQKGGSELSVTGNSVWFWYDTDPLLLFSSELVDVSFLSGETCVEFAFSNKGQYGNHIWIDNVNLDGEYAGFNELIPNDFVVYPNPSNGSFSVRSSQTIDELMIYDMTGNLVYSESQNNNYAKLNLNGVAKGIYLVKVRTSIGLTTKRITIN